MDYVIDANTNRYDSVGGNSLAYNQAGDLTTDKDAYAYQYDYENRITKIRKPGPITVAEYAYDALGRRIKKTDSIASQSTVYYYNDKWQVLCEYGGRNWATMLQWFAYGNQIDETLIKGKQNDETPQSVYLHLYVQDHLFSPVALVQRYQLNLLERYEYDAYGNCQILSPTYQARATSSYNNPYFFTGRTLDTLDNANLKPQDNRNRYYDTYTGRFLTHDPIGYFDGMNLYEYVNSHPIISIDFMGLCQCETTHVSKRCWINGKTWDYNFGGLIGSFPLSDAVPLLEWVGGAVKSATQIFGTVKDLVPSAAFVKTVKLRTRWVRFCVTYCVPCGSDEKWDIAKAKSDITNTKKTGKWQSEPDWLFTPVGFPLVEYREILRQTAKDYPADDYEVLYMRM